MKQQRDEAYVLRTQELGEADLIVSLVACNHGKVRGVARSAKRSRRRFGGALEPLTRVQAVWTEKAGRELHRIDALDVVRSFAEMQSDPVRLATCAVLAEVSEAVARECEPDPKSFKLLGAVLEALENGLDPWAAVRYFEYWMLTLHGLLPDVERCAICNKPLGRSACVAVGVGLRCGRCGTEDQSPSYRLGPADRAFLDTARRMPPAELSSRHGRAVRPGGGLEALLRRTLEAYAERRFRAYRHMRAVSEPPAGPRGER